MATVLYVDSGYYTPNNYVQEGLFIDWINKIIYIPKAYMELIQTSPVEVRELNTNTFRLDLKDLEDSVEGMPYPDTHKHVAGISVGGVELARVIEIINGYTITFEDGQYAVNLSQSNNNIGDNINVNQVSVRSANSAGLLQTREIEQSSYNSLVVINSSGTAGISYPLGTFRYPVSNLTDAKTIATQRGLNAFYFQGNYTIASTDNVTALKFAGDGATMNVYRTTITLTQGCITTNSHWKECRITGYQGGESYYEDCVIDGLENAHCFYVRCGLLDGTARGYTIKQTSGVSSGHASYFKECFSDEGTAILDRNGARLNVTFDGWHGRLKIINQNHATSSGQVWIHMNGGTLTVDSSCTKGKVTVTGFGTLVNDSLGTEVDASGFAAEVAYQQRIDTEAMRETHQGFGGRWFVDPINGSDLSPGNSPASPLQTVTQALSKAVSGRGDVIYLLAPGDGAATINERISIDKEDIHIRGPGRGVQFQPSTPDLGDVITINANNCSLSSFIVRAASGSTTDNCITINGKFSKSTKLYLVGTEAGTGNGFLLRGGDYHELINCESEKMGGSGLKTYDAGLASGSPREITVRGGNWYLNRKDGIELTSNTAASAGTSTRIIRILGANVHDNYFYGISADSNCTRVVIDTDATVHSNIVEEIYNLSPSLQHFSDRELIAQVKYRVETLRKTHQAFGEEFYVDPINGNDASIGTSDFNPFLTVNRALQECVSGRGDVIYLLAPGAGTATIAERILIDKEDVHIRGPGRGVQFQPSTTSAGGYIIHITANNCSLSGFIVRSNANELDGSGIRIQGKFSRLEKIYCVGPGQTTNSNTCIGIEFTGGDYHELYDMEVEKYGDSGIELNDLSDTHSNGSPREITISGGNIYLNGEHGICLHGKIGAALGSTSRIIRLINSVNVHDNLSFGVHADNNVLGVVIDSSILLHDNNGGNANPQTSMEGTYYDKAHSSYAEQADTVWTHTFTSKLLTVAKFLGLK